MELQEAKDFTLHKLGFGGHKSDGCTLVPDFIFKPACQLHDMLIRFKAVSRKEADELYLEYMLELAEGEDWVYNLVAYTYYYAMRYVDLIFDGDFTLALGLHGLGAVILALYLI